MAFSNVTGRCYQTDSDDFPKEIWEVENWGEDEWTEQALAEIAFAEIMNTQYVPETDNLSGSVAASGRRTRTNQAPSWSDR